MLDLSFAEIALVAVAGVVFLKPKDLPAIVRTAAKAMRSLRAFSKELRDVFEEVSKESGLKDAADEVNAELRMIRGDDGKMYEAYKVDDSKTPTNPRI